MRSRTPLFITLSVWSTGGGGVRETLGFSSDSSFAVRPSVSIFQHHHQQRRRNTNPGFGVAPRAECFSFRTFRSPLSMVATEPDLDSTDPFSVLGLDPYSDPIDKSVIKQAYKRLAMQYHPDVATNKESTDYEKRWASDQFSKINSAYETLSRNLEAELASRLHFWRARRNNGRSQQKQQRPKSHTPFGGYWVGANDFDLPKYDSVHHNSGFSDESSKQYWNSPKVQGPEQQYGSCETPYGGHWVGAKDFKAQPNNDAEDTYGEETIFGDFFTGNFEEFFTGATGLEYPSAKQHDRGKVKQQYNDSGEGSETVYNDFAAKVGSVDLKPRSAGSVAQNNEGASFVGAETVFTDYYSGEEEEEKGAVSGENILKQNFEASVSGKPTGPETVFTDFLNGKIETAIMGNEDSNSGQRYSSLEDSTASGDSSSTSSKRETADSDQSNGAHGMYFGTMHSGNKTNNNGSTNNSDSGTSNGSVSSPWEAYYGSANGGSVGQAYDPGTGTRMRNGATKENTNTDPETGNEDEKTLDAAAAKEVTEIPTKDAGGTPYWTVTDSNAVANDSVKGATNDSPGNIQESTNSDVEVKISSYDSTVGATYGSNGVSYDYTNANGATGSSNSNGAKYNSENGVTYGSNGVSNGYENANEASSGSYDDKYDYGNDASTTSNSNEVNYDYTNGPSSGSNGNYDYANGATSGSNGVSYDYKNGVSKDTSGLTYDSDDGSNGVSYESQEAQEDLNDSDYPVDPDGSLESSAAQEGTSEADETPSIVSNGSSGMSYSTVSFAGVKSYEGPEEVFMDFVSGAKSAARSNTGGGVFQDIVDILKRNVDGNVGGSGYILGGDDPDLNKLLHAGTAYDIGHEMIDTELVVQHLTSKREDLVTEISRIKAELATNTKLSNKIALEQMEAECRARKVVVEEFLPRALERMRSLQTRYLELIDQLEQAHPHYENEVPSGQKTNMRVQGSSWRSNWPPSAKSKHPTSHDKNSKGQGPPSPHFYATAHPGQQGPAGSPTDYNMMSEEQAAREKRVKLLQVDDRFDSMIQDFENTRKGRFSS